MPIRIHANKEIGHIEIAAELLGTAILLDPSVGEAWFASEKVHVDLGDGREEIRALEEISPWSLFDYKALCEFFPFRGVSEAIRAGFHGSAVTLDNGWWSVGVYVAEREAKFFRERISSFYPATNRLPITTIDTQGFAFAQSTLSHGGASISPVGGAVTGTLGAWLEDFSSGELIGISANHVLTEFNLFGIGTDLIQPGLADGGSHNVTGDIYDFVPLLDDDPKNSTNTSNVADLAWCRPKPTTLPQQTIGSPPGIKVTGEVDLFNTWLSGGSVNVVAVGRGNNRRHGTLRGKGPTWMQNQANQKSYYFRNQLEFSFNGGAQPGDLGSLILLEPNNEVGALLFAIDPTDNSRALGCPWQTVTREMKRTFRY